jgi:hypothetical protein
MNDRRQFEYRNQYPRNRYPCIVVTPAVLPYQLLGPESEFDVVGNGVCVLCVCSVFRKPWTVPSKVLCSTFANAVPLCILLLPSFQSPRSGRKLRKGLHPMCSGFDDVVEMIPKW